VHVAQLAGVPKGVIKRAREILFDLESKVNGSTDRGHQREVMNAPLPSGGELSFQLTLFGEPNPVVEEIKALDIESMSPLDALTKLYDLQRKAVGKIN